MDTFYRGIIASGTFFQPILLLAIRLFWGSFFAFAGFGKFLHPETVAEYFTSLNIPIPLLSVYITAAVELLGGLAMILGFSARLMSIPLIAVMITALVTADREALGKFWLDPQSIILLSPFTFLLAALIIFAFGPGKLSFDAWLRREK